jgi:DeoR/GlpR family transcriptional regulator of sugar metabolism
VLTAERQRRTLEALARDGRVVSAELAERLGVSLDTVRRDLTELEAAGALRRVRGGAMPPATVVPPRHEARAELRTAEKAAIAEYAAARLARDWDVVLLGGGTTMVELARRWPAGRRTTALTAGIDVAGALAGRPDVELVLLGGRVLPDARTAVGADTVAAIAGVRADACVLGTCSLDLATGLSVYEREEAQVARAMIDAARTTVVLADADKLGTTGRFAVAPPERIDLLVTDRSAPAEILEALADRGTKVARA